MRLRRVEIANFRKLQGPVVLDGLDDGLVIVSGDNEEGKSTVLAALKAAFFEHHAVGGAYREGLAPHRGGVPEVAVAFEAGGRSYFLRKAFKRGGISLQTPEGLLGDDAAERALQELLRFERRQARTPRPENLGLQALFWVDQATTFQGFEMVAGGRDRLAAAIAGEVGTVAGGERTHRLICAVRSHVERFFTEKRRQETGPLKAAADHLARLEAERQQLEGRRQEHESRVDRLARRREERQRFITGDSIGHAQERLQTARRRLAEATMLERQAELRREGLKAASAELARLQARQAERTRLANEAQQTEMRLREFTRLLKSVRLELEVARDAVDLARKREAAAAISVETLAAARDRARQKQAFLAACADVERLAEAVERAAAAQAGAGRAQAVLGASKVSEEMLPRLRGLHSQREQALIRVEAAATRLELLPDGLRQASLNGKAVEPGQPLRIGAQAELVLEGFGRIIVMPGGEELPARQQALRETGEALEQALARLNVASLAEAEQALDRRRAAEAELGRHEADIRALQTSFGVRSLDELTTRLASRRAEAEALLAQLGAVSGLEPAETVAQEIDRLDRELGAARTELDQVRLAARTAEEHIAAQQAEEARLEAQQRSAAEQLAGLNLRLAREREEVDDAQLTASIAAASRHKETAELEVAVVEREMRGQEPEGLREEERQAERGLGQLEAERQRLDREVRDLEVALKESGADVFGERLAEIAGEIARARAEHARLEREARAWQLLLEKLEAADRATREALVAPISLRLTPLLQRVFPGADPVLDPDRLALTHLCRDGVQEAYDSLSIGAREQLAVLVRLAFARLLQEREGEASCLILDDALVYADEQRFAAMKATLQRAAKDVQILILTCRPRDYFGLEARYLRLEDCRRT